MVEDAGLAATLHDVTAIAISPAALAPAAGLPFKAVVAAERPSRQAVLDEIDRLAEAPVQGQATMSDASEPLSPPPDPPPVPSRLSCGAAWAWSAPSWSACWPR